MESRLCLMLIILPCNVRLHSKVVIVYFTIYLRYEKKFRAINIKATRKRVIGLNQVPYQYSQAVAVTAFPYMSRLPLAIAEGMASKLVEPIKTGIFNKLESCD